MGRNGTYEELFEEIETDLLTVGQELAIEWEVQVGDELYRMVYTETPSEYERTNDLLDSLHGKAKKMANGEVVIEVAHNTDEIKPNPDGFQHYSPISGDSSDFLPQIIEAGSGGLFGKGYWTKKRPYFTKIVNRIENGEGVKAFKRNLKAKGWTVK